MRKRVLLAIVAPVVLLGLVMWFVLRAPAPPISSAPPAPQSTSPPPDSVTAYSTPEAVHAWRRDDKDRILETVSTMRESDVDFLCLTLGLIPNDEIFDKINVKKRLTRHVNRLSTDAEFKDLETAFRTLRTERSPAKMPASASLN